MSAKIGIIIVWCFLIHGITGVLAITWLYSVALINKFNKVRFVGIHIVYHICFQDLKDENERGVGGSLLLCLCVWEGQGTKTDNELYKHPILSCYD